MNGHSSVAVIILTYNSEAIIERCIKSFLQADYPRISFFLVDNLSSDNTALVIKEKFPTLNLICTGVNSGYTGGNNKGLELALAADNDYVLIVNPDAVLYNPSFIAMLVSEFEKRPEIGIAGPRVFFRSTEVVQNTILFPPALKRNIKHWVQFRLDASFAQLSGNESVPAQMLNGVCVMIRSQCLKCIGLFDESLFMYIEDADLSYRARLAGWSVRYLPIDSVIHEQKQEGYESTGLVAALLKRNSTHYLVKIGDPLEALGYSVFSLALAVAKCCVAAASLTGARKQLAFLNHIAFKFYQALAQKTLGRRYMG